MTDKSMEAHMKEIMDRYIEYESAARRMLNEHRSIFNIAREKEMTERQNRFKVGDVVILKSGGHKMTITVQDDHRIGEVECIWFATGDPKIQSASIPVCALEHY